MATRKAISRKTRTNWLIDTVVFTGAVLAGLSGIYFLIFPRGGYQGGRNPWHGIVIFFTREGWDTLHTWAGIAMIVAVIVHLTLHLSWVRLMAVRVWRSLWASKATMSKGARLNLWVNIAIAAGFIGTAVSGIVLFFAPHGGMRGDTAALTPIFVFTRAAWDVIHTWAGVVLIIAAAGHFIIHWKWITKVTAKVFMSLKPQVS